MNSFKVLIQYLVLWSYEYLHFKCNKSKCLNHWFLLVLYILLQQHWSNIDYGLICYSADFINHNIIVKYSNDFHDIYRKKLIKTIDSEWINGQIESKNKKKHFLEIKLVNFQLSTIREKIEKGAIHILIIYFVILYWNNLSCSNHLKVIHKMAVI